MHRNLLATAIRAALVVSTLDATGAASAEASFTTRLIDEDLAVVQGVFGADLDLDGDTDLLIAEGGTVRWYENDGQQRFTRRMLVPATVDGVISLFVTDIDGDGDQDVAVVGFLDDEVAWLENDGVQSFTKRIVDESADQAVSVTVADLDGDDNLDLLTANGNDDTVAWYESDGLPDPGFTKRTVAADLVDARAVFAADVDGDGDTDVVAAGASSNTVAWFENDGMQPPTFTRRDLVTDLASPTATFAIDVNDDGAVDILAASDDGVIWYESDGQADPTFTTRTLATDVISPAAFTLFAGDFDGDGDVDVLAGEPLTWFENDGLLSPGFTRHTVSTVAADANGVFAADVDGDGDLDPISGDFQLVAWHDFVGRDRFPPFSGIRTIAAGGASPTGVGDLDGDGDLDVLARGSWFDNSGGLSFVQRTIDPATSADVDRAPVQVIDIDGDGDFDIAAGLLELGGPDAVGWFRNDGGGSFSFQTVASNVDYSAGVIAVDLDDDGSVDLAYAEVFDDDVVWLANDGSQQFSATIIASLAGSIRELNAADVDSDGDIDLYVIASEGDDNGYVYWLENQGAGSFAVRTISTGIGFGTVVTSGDLDGDGDLDLASNADPGNSEYEGQVLWYENDGSQNFTRHTVSVGASISGLAAVDLDGDGDLDLATNLFGYDGGVEWHENDGSGQFRMQTILVPDSDPGAGLFVVDIDRDGDRDLIGRFNGVSVAAIENRTIHRSAAFTGERFLSTVAVAARRVTTADFDGDGDLDALSGHGAGSDKLVWYRNEGGRSFTRRVIPSSSATHYDLSPVDVDGDGDTDFFTGSSSLTVAWHENSGSGTFSEHFINTDAGVVRSVHAVDVDGDGDIDLAVARRVNPYVGSAFDGFEWYENDGAEQFSIHAIGTASMASHALPVDLDRDGDIDFATASLGDNTVAWWENAGDESFVRHVITDTAACAYRVDADDVDGDGDLDVLSASICDSTIAWYENTGGESFTSRVLSTVAGMAYDVLAVDLDGDGDQDVLGAAYGSDAVVWYENDGTQNFTTRTITTSADGASSAIAADLDGDGDLDVLSAARFGEEIAWFENCGGQFLFAGESAGSIVAGGGSAVGLLELDILHNGRGGDANAVLDAVSLAFTDLAGVPLSTFEADALIDAVHLYRDNGDGFFIPSSDTLVGTLGRLDFTPNGLKRGIAEVPLSAPVSIAPGASAKLFAAVDLTADAALQSTNAFRVVLNQVPLPRPQASDATSASVLSLECAMNAASGEVTVVPTVDLSVDIGQGTETAQTPFTVTATADVPVSGDVILDVVLASAGVAPDVDGPVRKGQTGDALTILAGQTTGSLSYTIVDDDLLEGTELLTIDATVFSGNAVLDASGTSLQIIDNDEAFLTISDVQAFENDGTITFSATLTGDVTGPFTVPFSLAPDTALPASDYQNTAGTLSFDGNPPETETFSVTLLDDAVIESTERFTANLGAPSNALITVSDASAAGTIVDDDAAGLTITDTSRAEDGAGAFEFTVTLTGGDPGPFTVPVSLAAGTATAGEDFTNAGGTLNFAGVSGESQTFSVTIASDAVVELDETFTAMLGSPSIAQVNVNDGEATGTISNDDTATISINDVAASEGDSGEVLFRFEATIDNAVDTFVDFEFASADGTAIAADGDYLATFGPASFNGTVGESQELEVSVFGDMTVEPDETFSVVLSNVMASGRNVTIGDGVGTGTILNDDADGAAPVVEDADFVVAEGTPDGAAIGQVVATDDETLPTTGAYAIIAGNDAGAFAIDDSGTITLADGTALPEAGIVTLTVEVSDSMALTGTGTVIIRLGQQVFADGYEGDDPPL